MPGWVWDSLQADFEDGLERLKQFVAREGHARVPQRHKNADGFALGTWVGSRRKYYKKSELSPERIAALEAVPGWVWDPFEYDFQNGLERLKQFIAREGHARVPLRHKDAVGFALGQWVTNRRMEYKKGNLLPERIAALEAVPGWVWNVLQE